MRITFRLFLFLFLICPLAQASIELDKKYYFSRVGVLRAADNVDGIFGDALLQTAEEVVRKNARFIWVDLAATNRTLGQTAIPSIQWIEDEEVLKTVIKKHKLDLLILTTAKKTQGNYKFRVELKEAKELRMLSSSEFAWNGDSPSAYEVSYQKSLKNLFDTIPFIGQISGRDRDMVTVSINGPEGLAPGDILEVATVDQLQFHPLLKTTVSWKMSPLGSVEVQNVDGDVVFAKIAQEDFGKTIQKMNKIVQVKKKPKPELTQKDKEKSGEDGKKPQFGYVEPGLMLGTYARDFGTTTSTVPGGAKTFGIRARGELWLTGQFSVLASVSYRYGRYTPDNSGASSSLGISDYRLMPGWSYTFSKSEDGMEEYKRNSNYSQSVGDPKVGVRLGYSKTTFSMPVDSSRFTSSHSIGTLLLRVEGSLPIRKDWTVELDLATGLFTSGSDNGNFNGGVKSASTYQLGTGALYHLDSMRAIRVRLEFESYSMDFNSGRTVSHQNLLLAPSFLLYF